MALSSGMQMISGSNTISRTAGFNKFVVQTYAPVVKRNFNFRVRSAVEDDASTPDLPRPISPKKPKVSTNFTDILAFSGPAPERINGRLAMIGFVSAIGVELSQGQDIFSQLQNGGLPWFVGTSALLTLASLIPLFQGVTPEQKSGDLLTSDAEIWNGRFAMLGLVALAFTEFVKGSALV